MVKKAANLKVTKKRNGKFMVRKRGGGLLHGAEKVKVLEEKGVVKKLKAKAKANPEGEAPAT